MKQLLLTLLLLSGYAFCQGGTTSSDLFPVTTGQNLGSSSKRWNVYAQSLNITGTVTCTGSCNLSTSGGSSTALLTSVNTWTKNNTFPSITFTSYTVATLPSTLAAGSIAVVRDGQSASDCTSGAGSTYVNCRYTGSAWAVLGGGSSSPITGATVNGLVTAATSTSLQTPSTTATMDGSGNIQTPGSVTAGYNDPHAGAVVLGQGTAWGTGTTAVLLTAPTSVTSYNIVFPSAAATGFFRLTNAANIVTGSIAPMAASDLPVPFTTVSSGAIGALSSANGLAQIVECTATCSVTPMSPPAAGYQLCVLLTSGVTGTITLNALGNSAFYPKTDYSGYGTAGTGTMVASSSTGNRVCLIGKDATHYEIGSYNGTFTSN